MSTADLTSEQVVERDWPVWANTLRPRVRSARVELFQEFVAWMREQAAPMWEGQSGHVLSTMDHHTQRETLAKALVRDARDEVLCADWWDRLISAGNSLKGWNIPLLPPVVRMPLLQPMVVRRDFLLLQAFRQFELKFWEKLRGGMAGQQLRGMLMCSAVLCGGVSCIETLAAIGQFDAMAVREHKGELRVRLCVRGGRRGEWRKWWYPDAQTSVLLVRCMGSGLLPILSAAHASPEAASQCLQEGIAALDVPCIPTDEFLRAAYVSHSFQLPRLCVEYLSGKIQAESLPAPVLMRLSDWDLCAQDIVDANDTSGVEAMRSGWLQSDHVYDPQTNPQAQQKFISRILNFLAKKPDPI